MDITCPAKVNLALSVGSPRADGMHPIASWMVAVVFGDRLHLSPLETGPSSFDIAFDDAAPVRAVIDWPLEKDLAVRALRMLEEHGGRPLPVALRLRKLVPAGAGLGGGSSDAAGVLVGINELYQLGLDADTLAALGQRLGSDVGFLVRAVLGQPSGLVTGLGERVEPLPAQEPIPMVLIFPPFGCATGSVYRAFDQRHPPTAPRDADEQRVRALAAQRPVPPDAPFNDLAEPACQVQLDLGRLLGELRQKLQLPVHVTGSGSTMFFIAPSAESSEALAKQVTEISGLAAVATRTL